MFGVFNLTPKIFLQAYKWNFSSASKREKPQISAPYSKIGLIFVSNILKYVFEIYIAQFL